MGDAQADSPQKGVGYDWEKGGPSEVVLLMGAVDLRPLMGTGGWLGNVYSSQGYTISQSPPFNCLRKSPTYV